MNARTKHVTLRCDAVHVRPSLMKGLKALYFTDSRRAVYNTDIMPSPCALPFRLLKEYVEILVEIIVPQYTSCDLYCVYPTRTGFLSHFPAAEIDDGTNNLHFHTSGHHYILLNHHFYTPSSYSRVCHFRETRGCLPWENLDNSSHSALLTVPDPVFKVIILGMRRDRLAPCRFEDSVCCFTDLIRSLKSNWKWVVELKTMLTDIIRGFMSNWKPITVLLHRFNSTSHIKLKTSCRAEDNVHRFKSEAFMSDQKRLCYYLQELITDAKSLDALNGWWWHDQQKITPQISACRRRCQNSGAVWKARWPSWAPRL